MGAGLISCAVYARVSTGQQGDSIENQISQCREYISRLGDQYDAERILVYRDEAVSGYYTSVFDRAEMKQAILDARNGKFQLLVFKEVSRVGRDKQENPAIIGMFEQYGVRVVAINDNYDSLHRDNITFDILSVLSEQESKKISARVSSARKQKARRGQWGGEPPIGYFVNKETKKLEIDPQYEEIPRLVFDLYVNGGMGTFKVAEYLNRKGLYTRRGNLWSRESVNKLLRNQAYIGNVVYGSRRNQLQRKYDDSGKMTKRKVQIRLDPQLWQVVENAHEPLVERGVYEAAQQILVGRSRRGGARRACHPLTGLLVCGRCGEGMVCQKRAHQGRTYRYYICSTYHKYGRGYCSQSNVNADELESEVMGFIRSRLDGLPDELILIQVDTESNLSRLRQMQREKQKQRDVCIKARNDLFDQRDLFDAGTYRSKMLGMKQQITRLGREIETLERQMQAAGNGQQAQPVKWEEALREYSMLQIMDRGRKRMLLHELIQRMVLTERHLDIVYQYDFNC